MVWNWALEHWNKDYGDGGQPSGNELRRRFNAVKYTEFPWLKKIHRDAHCQPFSNLQRAFFSFFRGIKGRPSFKKKGHAKDSFYASGDRVKCRSGDKTVTLPLIGNLRMRESLRISGHITSATVSRTADKWFISLKVGVGDYRKPRTGNGTVGIDIGISTAATVSDGQVFIGPRALTKNLKKLKRASRRHSRKQRGSKNRAKATIKLARLNARIANVRKDFLHKTTTKLCRENQAIYLEDLSVKNMMKNRHLSRAISDMGWREFRRQIEYKSLIYDCKVGIIDRWFPSSKVCRKCGVIRDDLKLSERMFYCGSCGHFENRDLNASHNICTAGMAGIYAHGPEGSGRATCGKTKPRRVEVRTKTHESAN